MSARLPLASLIAALALGAPACDTDGDDPGGGPTTSCDFNYALKDQAAKDFGQACTTGAECKYGVCLMPGDDGNIENSQFGYCTRGCDCGDDTASRLSAEEKATLTCIYPTGFMGRKRHVVPLCSDLSSCTSIDASWTECTTPVSGGARPICHAL